MSDIYDMTKYLISYNEPLHDGTSEEWIEGYRLENLSGMYNYAVFEMLNKRKRIFYVLINKAEATIN